MKNTMSNMKNTLCAINKKLAQKKRLVNLNTAIWTEREQKIEINE